MRHTPPVLGKTPHFAGQPIMAVDKVITDFVTGNICLKRIKYFRQVSGKHALCDMSLVTDSQMDEADIVGQEQPGVPPPAVGAGIDIDTVPGSAQFPGKFTDVNAHAARVLGPEFTERARMDTERGYSQWPDIRV